MLKSLPSSRPQLLRNPYLSPPHLLKSSNPHILTSSNPQILKFSKLPDLKQSRRPHPPADAHRHHNFFRPAALPFDERVPDQPGAAHPVRMADRNRAAVDVAG